MPQHPTGYGLDHRCRPDQGRESDCSPEALDQLKHATGAIDKAAQRFAGIGPFGPLTTLVEEPLGPSGVFGWWQIKERQVVAGLEVNAFLFEFRLALGLDEGRRGVGKAAFRIVEGGMAPGLDEDRPSRSQAPQRIVGNCSPGVTVTCQFPVCQADLDIPRGPPNFA